ncbi:MAG TPA: glycosyltransferase [Nitrospiraceae bacterium]|nr:glycosyltransferase [Nitrospiraceae bacterium]
MRKVSPLKQQIETSKPYVLASEARSAFKVCLRDLDGYVFHRRCISLKCSGSPRGQVLLSYIIDGFLASADTVRSNHPNYWEAVQIAQTFLDLGYDIDIVSYRNSRFWPDKDYSVVIDSRHNLERLAPMLSPSCLKIHHADTAHILFQNAAEAQRLVALQRRRGVTLRPRRFERPNLGIEHADYATILGNQFTAGTYRYANKPMACLPIPSQMTWPWPQRADSERVRKRFLFLSSGGLVHKGLDLLLEAFVDMPEYHLTICAPINPLPPAATSLRPSTMRPDMVDSNYYANPTSMLIEEDFRLAFQKELYETPNIHTIGWIDIADPKFFHLAQSCIAVVYPSCSEGASTAVITCLHTGLIPIMSYESGIDVHNFGLLLKTCSIDEIQEAVHAVASLPDGQIEQRSRHVWEFARAYHTRERYAEEYRRVIEAILQGRLRQSRNPEQAPRIGSGC